MDYSAAFLDGYWPPVRERSISEIMQLLGHPPSVASPAPLSPAHLQQLEYARVASKKIRRAVAVAHFDGWGTAIFGALTLLGALLSFSWIAMLLGAGMIAVAVIEFRGAV